MAEKSDEAIHEDDGDFDEQIAEELVWELDEGIPQFEDPFIQKYFRGREALIAQEKKQRHDVPFKNSMTPIASRAAKILSAIRRRELRTIWTSSYESSIEVQEHETLYPGMMFTLARDRMVKTDLFKIIERMPKGALLHAHLDAMIDIDWLVEQVLGEKGMCILWLENGGVSEKVRKGSLGSGGGLQFRVFGREEIQNYENSAGIWTQDYKASTPIPVVTAAKSFPENGEQGFKNWLIEKCVITNEESLCHHQGLDAIWRKFQSTFPIIGWMLFYEPILRRAFQRLFEQLAKDGIVYVDLRCAFMFEFRRTGKGHGEQGFMEWFEVFDEEIEKFKGSELGQKVGWKGARMIWTVIRKLDNKMVIAAMKECVRIKKRFPHLISGFDFVAQEDQGRPLADLVPLVFWFRKRCVEEGVDIPFFFHAGECLGDGDETDQNLFDAILLGTRRIGHGYSLYKHPLLIDMVKEKKILVESCPISNEILRLSSSIMSHSLPALLSRGVAVSLNNDDPAILGHGKNGLSHDFWQSYMAFENLGLEGLATMAENSLKWCAIEDKTSGAWLMEIKDGYMGKGMKAKLLKEWRSEFEKWCQWIIMEYPLEGDDEDEEGER